MNLITKKYGFNTLDDLFAAVGYGGITAQKVVMRLRNNWVAEQEKEEERKRLESAFDGGTEIVQTAEPKKRTSEKGIIVKGIDNCLVRLAHCCTPVAGDPIVGFITKGRGVSVHRADCPNVQPENLPPEDRERFIDVEWDVDKATSYEAKLQIEGTDRDGVLMEITNILATLKVPFKSVNAYVTKKGMAVIQIGVELRNTSDLELLKKKFKQVRGIKSVTRMAN